MRTATEEEPMFRHRKNLARCLACGMLLALIFVPDVALAQTGLGSPAAGGLVLLVIGVLALIGFSILVVSSVLLIRHGPSLTRLLSLGLGLVLQSPAIWFVWTFLAAETPWTKSWDFSLNCSVSQLDRKAGRRVDTLDYDEYSYQGNIRSSIKLPSNKQWSGSASLVVLEARLGEVTAIYWSSRRANAAGAYQQTKRILEQLGFTDHGLDSWYANARQGDPSYFSVETDADADPNIEVTVKSVGDAEEGKPERIIWYVVVEVRWKDADG